VSGEMVVNDINPPQFNKLEKVRIVGLGSVHEKLNWNQVLSVFKNKNPTQGF
jgi:hypothetical protein